jgi:hypothetical protein
MDNFPSSMDSMTVFYFLSVAGELPLIVIRRNKDSPHKEGKEL